MARCGALPVPGEAIVISNEFLHRFCRRGIRHEHVVRKAEEVRDRRKVGDRIIAERPREAGRNRQRGRGVEDRVAVRCGLCDQLARDVGATARPVLDHDLLPPHSRQRLGHDTGGDVGRPAGRQGHDQPHEAVRPVLRLRLRAASDGGGNDGSDRRCNQSPPVDHGAPCSMPVFLMKGSAAGELMNLISSRAASGCVAPVWTPPAKTLTVSISFGTGPTYWMPG